MKRLLILFICITCVSCGVDNETKISTKYREVISTNTYINKTNTSQIVRVHFEHNKYEFAKEFIEDTILNDLKTNSNILKVYIEGHTDNTGKEAYNNDLGFKRATTIQSIISNHYPSKNIELKSFGYSKPIELNDTIEGKAANRRADVYIEVLENIPVITTNKEPYNVVTKSSINNNVIILIIIILIILFIYVFINYIAPLLVLLLKGAGLIGISKFMIGFCPSFSFNKGIKTVNINKISKKIYLRYIKRLAEEREILRNKFNSSDRKNFLKFLYDKYGEQGLKKLGLSNKDIQKMKDCKVPDGCQVHHKIPLDDGGNNSFENLQLIRNNPYHICITAYQNSQIKQNGIFKWPYSTDDILI